MLGNIFFQEKKDISVHFDIDQMVSMESVNEYEVFFPKAIICSIWHPLGGPPSCRSLEIGEWTLIPIA